MKRSLEERIAPILAQHPLAQLPDKPRLATCDNEEVGGPGTSLERVDERPTHLQRLVPLAHSPQGPHSPRLVLHRLVMHSKEALRYNCSDRSIRMPEREQESLRAE